MAVAVLIPAYRGDDAAHFDAALRSVETQEACPEDIHIYLGIDGPLPSELEDVVQWHRGQIHQLVRHADPIGPTRTLNSLIAILENERLVFRMDADDVSRPDRFRKQIAFMDQHPDIAILGTAVEEFDEQGTTTTIRRFPTESDRVPILICRACPVAHPSICMRPEVLRIMNGYPDIRGQDLALWFEALARGFRICNLDEALVMMRVSPSFYARRSDPVRMWPEFRIYVQGIWKLHGLTWRYVFPLARLAVRLSGPRLARRLYQSNFRNLVTR